MESNLNEITYDIELQPGEALTLPKEAAQVVGPGHWIVSIRPASLDRPSESVRRHTAFLSSYAPEDEGLYDDYSAG
jgi:hypothetical protein